MSNTNKVNVSINIAAEIEVTEELKARLKKKHPFVDFQSDDDYATVYLFELSDNCLPKLVSWGGQEVELNF